MNPDTSKEIARLQDNLQTIRKVAGWTTEELGDRIGVTKQTISNLENKKTEMTKTQYIALRTILDYEMASNPDSIALARVVDVLLNTDDSSDEDDLIEKNVSEMKTGKTGKDVSQEIPSFLLKKPASKKAASTAAKIVSTSAVALATSPIAIAATAGWLAKIMTDKK